MHNLLFLHNDKSSTCRTDQKKSSPFYVLVLDIDLDKIPEHLLNLDDPIFEFNKQIIDATNHLCVAFKPNIAFYEAYGLNGWRSLHKTISYLKRKPS